MGSTLSLLGEYLHNIQSDPAKTVEQIHKEFTGELRKRDDQAYSALRERLNSQRRRDWEEVFLVASEGNMYGPRSSVLNRLLVAQLEHLGAFRLIPGEVDRVAYRGGRYHVTFKGGKTKVVDEVVPRRGPTPEDGCALRRGGALTFFPQIAAKCVELEKIWDGAGARDETRKKLWRAGLFEESQGQQANRRPAVSGQHGRGPLAVSTQRLSIVKLVRDDGSCSLTFLIGGLAATRGEVAGIEFSYETKTGSVGQPKLDADAESLGISWEPKSREQLDPKWPLARKRAWIGTLQGRFHFNHPLKSNHAPLSFGFTLSVLNGHARTAWEFEQLYPDSQGQDASEQFSCSVYFPTEELRVTLVLPQEVSIAPVAHQHLASRGPRRSEERGYISLRHLNEKCGAGKGQELPMSPSGESWELLVRSPPVGSCYQLRWPLPAAVDDPFTTKAAGLRKELASSHEALDSAFRNLIQQINKGLGRRLPGEIIEVRFMVYDDDAHQLFVARAASNGRPEAAEGAQDFALPYGFGIGGSCFKEAENFFLYLKPAKADGRPLLHVPVHGHPAREVLIAVPLNVPETESTTARLLGDRGRRCLGVVLLSSNRANTRLKDFVGRRGRSWLLRQCRLFGSSVGVPAE